MRICMLSSLHSADDVRIVEKEARCLLAAGHHVTVVARPPAPAEPGGIDFKLLDLPDVPRWKRPWVMGRAALALARSSRPDVVQFHDPELIFAALSLRKDGRRVIYDVHEDVPADIRSKRWIPGRLRPFVALLAGALERLTARRFDAIVAATPTIAERFQRYGARVVLIRNSVKLSEFMQDAIETPRRRQAAYVGRISFDRGLVEMVEACRGLGLPLVMAGSIGAEEKTWLAHHEEGVEWRGRLDRKAIARLLSQSTVGFCFLHAEANYLRALPTKIFEYMAAGLPVITSDLPVAKEIVEQARCGLVVANNDPEALKQALSQLAGDSAEVSAMGSRGRAAAGRLYNWEHDAAALVELYGRLSPVAWGHG
jgi:glycosyltransferase involved in cell wall biosynthesis